MAAAIVLLVAGSFGAAYSPLFAVKTINVVGTRSLDAGEVEHALSGQLGTPLPSVDAGEVKAALVAFPLVQSYSLEARPPHELVVRIVERTPVGVIKGPAGYTLVDAAGVALATTATAPKGQPTITVGAGTTSEAFRAAGQVVRSLPASIRTKVTAVTATTPDDVTLTLGGTGQDPVGQRRRLRDEGAGPAEADEGQARIEDVVLRRLIAARGRRPLTRAVAWMPGTGESVATCTTRPAGCGLRALGHVASVSGIAYRAIL
ncbi:FtsQ-type POTRA domain-containing protein [Microbacterium elymi]|uniref:FtsQ-type POTRA domain-containing protein n=1 Tax=Microbacterium elymi TaxID=2909587 RepID=A0ABY5NJA3_9MICO|nr:FtsQ-type POTRA domain-containing protein [Microbacterium elymi]UUT35206.1 FtsQ-type POTRA domain-containing protein [Microbacterium elymi]